MGMGCVFSGFGSVYLIRKANRAYVHLQTIFQRRPSLLVAIGQGGVWNKKKPLILINVASWLGYDIIIPLRKSQG